MPDLSIQLKRLGKKKIRTVDYTLPPIADLRELLSAIVRQEVEGFNARREEVRLMPFLTPGDIQAQSDSGKVGFGDIANRDLAEVEASVKTAIQAYRDGLFLVFHNDVEIRSLEEGIDLTEESVLAFLRMTFLTGTLW